MKNILRWIIFLPAAIIGASLSVIIFRFLDPMRDAFISLIWYPLIWYFIFWYISAYIIPSTPEKKVKIPLILVFILNCLSLFSVLIMLSIGEYKFNRELLSGIISIFIATGYTSYLLFFENGQEKIKETIRNF